MQTYHLVEQHDRWYVALPQHIQVTRLLFDYAVTLEMGYGEEIVSVRIETSLTLKNTIESQHLFPNSPESLGKLLLILHKNVREMSAYKDGRLEILLEDGYQLAVAAHRSYEAWTINTLFGSKLVSLPGGNIAVWSKQSN